MRAINLVGFKKSGKTTLAKNILDIWESKSIPADYLKFTHSSFDKGKNDTAMMANGSRCVFGVSLQESIQLEGSALTLNQVLARCKNDLLLIEGGKKQLVLPRVICTDSKEDFDELNLGLAIATYGHEEDKNISPLPHFTKDNLEALADLMFEKAFVLAGVNCKSCKRKTCYEHAQDIVAKKADAKECIPLNSENQNIIIEANGQVIPLNPFVQDIIKGSILGMISSLKDYTDGDINIRIKNNKNDK